MNVAQWLAINAQWLAISVCLILAVFGAICAGLGVREATLHSSTPVATAGLMKMVTGTIALGFAGLGISLAAKLLG